MPLVARELGVRIDVLWDRLTDAEHETGLHGPAVMRQITAPTRSKRVVTTNVEYMNAYSSVTQRKSEGEGAARFLTERQCETRKGSRHGTKTPTSALASSTIAGLTAMPLAAMMARLETLPRTVSARPLARADAAPVPTL